MSGILNNKERMIDFIITKMGRQQMSSGRMRIEFATLTDRHTFYQASGSEGVAEDASNRLYFEASERQQDIIVPELEDGHVMNPFRVGNLQISGKEFASGTFQKVGPVGVTTTFSGSEIVDNARLLTRGLASHWRDQKILGTKDFFSDKSGFVVNAHTASFVIADSTVENDRGGGDFLKDITPGDSTRDGVVSIDNSPSMFSDPRFQHLPNFKFLPPRNVPLPNQKTPGSVLGKYPELASTPQVLDNASAKNLKEGLGLINRQNIKIEFDDTSRENNFIAQVFEFSDEGVEKLSVIDYGHFEDDDLDSPGIQVYFVGKIIKDSSDTHTFMNIFTVVME